MKITLITSNQLRHKYLINILAQKCQKLFVLQESKTIFPGLFKGTYKVNKIIKKYFDQVNRAEKKIFGKATFLKNLKNVSILPISTGDLNSCSLNYLKESLKSDLYIVYGSSYIKGKLAKFLIKNKAINIHMGISPYYRGTDCNFWALYDGNPHLVGATIHYLSNKLDGGRIISHAMSKKTSSPFIYTMHSVKSAFNFIIKNIKNNKILKIKSYRQNKNLLIRYSRKKEFSPILLKKYLKKPFAKKISFNLKLLVNPYF